MQPKRRLARLGSQLREEISRILQQDVKDPRIGFVTVTEVSMTADLKMARVYVTILGEEQEQKDSLAGLNQACGFIRHELGRRLRLRYCPEVHFRLDESLEREERLEQLFEQIHHEQEEEQEERQEEGRASE